MVRERHSFDLTAPYNQAMGVLQKYNELWQEQFDWLDEVYEEAKRVLSATKTCLLPKTPDTKRNKRQKTLLSIPEDTETNNLSISKSKRCNPPRSKKSPKNLVSACPETRKSKRIASRLGNSQDIMKNTSDNNDSSYSNVGRLKLDRSKQDSFQAIVTKNLKDETSKENINPNSCNIMPNKIDKVTDTKMADQKIETSLKSNRNETLIISKTSKENSKNSLCTVVLSRIDRDSPNNETNKSNNEQVTKIDEFTTDKIVKKMKLDKTPQTNTGKKSPFISKLYSTPSVKDRIQTYEQNIKAAVTPKYTPELNHYITPLKRPVKQCSVFGVTATKAAQMSELHRRSSLVRYQLMNAKKHKGKRSSRYRKSKVSLKSNLKEKNLNDEGCMSENEDKETECPVSTASSEIKQTPEGTRTPVVALKRIEDLSPEEKQILNISSSSDTSHYTSIDTSAVTPVEVMPHVKKFPKQISKTVQLYKKQPKMATPVKSSQSASKLYQNRINRSSTNSQKQGLMVISETKLLSRVMSLRLQMTPNIKEKCIQEEMKKRRKREEEVLRNKDLLLKKKIEEQKKKTEERMRKVSEIRSKIEQEKDQKRYLEQTKEERCAQKEAELKRKREEVIRKKQMSRKQREAKVEQRRKKEEEIRLQKIKEQLEAEKQDQEKEKLLSKKLQAPAPKAIQNCMVKELKEKDGEKNEKKEKSPKTCNEKSICQKTPKNSNGKKNGAALNETYCKEDGNPDSYDMTPDRIRLPIPSAHKDNYDISDLKSDDDTDDESAPRKRVPNWAQGMELRKALIKQNYISLDLDALFGIIELPDLSLIFPAKNKRFQKRTSSAVWLSHSFTLSP